MAYLQTQCYAASLGMQTTISVILPEASQGIGVGSSSGPVTRPAPGDVRPVDPYAEPLPVLYLLHGLSDNHAIWMRRTAIDRYVSTRRVAVVMPEVQRSFYADMHRGLAYWRYVSEDLPAMCGRFFPISDRREDTFVAGLSMGGFGAFKLALRYPQRYAAAASLSGALDMATRCSRKVTDGEDVAWIREKEAIFGPLDQVPGGENDLVDQLGDFAKRPADQRPRLYQCVGGDDFLLDDNHSFRDRANALGIDLTYHEHPGFGHGWDYWDQRIVDVLDWMGL